MLSASTISSSSSSAFSSSQGISTPSSQYSNDSRKANSNPLTELIFTEQSYMETLKMIDSQIAPIWMKQMTSAAPDFSELLKYIHDILKSNKRFCMKLTKIAANPQAISELGDVLMQWVDDMEVPYANYCRSYIPNLNQRTDILSNVSIQSLLRNLSANVSYDINLESLFDAPIQQLKYYKGLYSRLLEGSDSGRADHKLLLKANKRIDMIMAMARNSTPNKSSAFSSATNINNSKKMDSNTLPFIQTDFQSSGNNTQSLDLTTFERQVDCSRTVDLYGGAQINYQLRISNPGTQLVMNDSFVMLPQENSNNGPSMRVRLVLTTEVLVICRELSSTQFLLLYPAIPIGDITVKAESLDREIVGEYIIRFSVLGKKHIIMRADSKDIRNTWIGVDQTNASNSVITTPRTLSVAAQKKMLSASSSSSNNFASKFVIDTITTTATNKVDKPIRNTDIYTYYSESGGVSPLESSDEEEDNNPLFKKYAQQQQQQKSAAVDNGNSRTGNSRDTIMDIYDNHLYDSDGESEFPLPPKKNNNDDLSNIKPQSVKILSHVPNVAQAQQNFNNGSIPTTNPNRDNSNVKDHLPPIPPNKQQPAGNQPVKDPSHVQMTYIQAPTAQMTSMSISPSTPANQHHGESFSLNNKSNPVSSSSSSSSLKNGNSHSPLTVNLDNKSIGAGMKNNMMNDNNTKPSSPRAIEVQRAVIPEVMQAVTQKTDEYISDKNSRQPLMNNNGSTPIIPRTSSMRGNSNAVVNNQGTSPRLQSQHQYHQQQQGPTPPPKQMMHNPQQPGHIQQNQYMGNQPRPGMGQQQNGYSGTGNHGQPRPIMNSQQQQRPNMNAPGQQYSNNRPMPSPPPQQQNFRPGPPPGTAMGYNNARPMPSPTLSPSLSNSGRGLPNNQGQPSLGLQQPPGRFNSPSPSMTHLHANNSGSFEDLSSPPHSPNPYNSGNDIRQILYSNNQCDVFHWHNQSWYAAEGQCLLQIRVTHTNRACVAVELQNTGQLYLNAWISPTTVIRTPSPTDVSLSVYMGTKKENYLIHFGHPSDAQICADLLYKVHADAQYQQQQQQQSMMMESVINETEPEEPEPVDNVNVPQTLKPVMQCKAKLFIKNETSNWSTFGGVTMRISQQAPSMRMMIQIENDKTKLVSAIVRSGNVEKISSKRISFLLVDEVQKTSIVYMIHLREDQTGNKIYEYLRTKNAENGW